MARLLQGESCLLTDCRKITKNGVICKLCGSGQPEDLAHLLFVCDYFQDWRSTLWNNVVSETPFAMSVDIALMNPWQRTHFLMSGLGGVYVPEWDTLYDAVIEFIFCMYRYRLKVQDQLLHV